MSPQERRIDMRDQGTIGGHGHSYKNPRHENTETSWKLFTKVSDRTRVGQESSGYIPKQDNCGKSNFTLTASENINSLLTDLFSKAWNTLSSPLSSPLLTPLTSSAVSLPLSNRKQKCYPPKLSALSYMTIINPLTALKSPSKYTDNEVGLRLTFFEKTNSCNLTPRSQIFIDLYQKTSLLLLSETDSIKKALH